MSEQGSSHSRIAGGTINPFSFIVRNPGVLLGALQATGSGTHLIGIAQEWNQAMYGQIGFGTNIPAATIGQSLRVYEAREDTIIQLGASGCNEDDLLTSDSNGNAIPVNLTLTTAVQWVGAQAIENGNAGNVIRCFALDFPYLAGSGAPATPQYESIGTLTTVGNGTITAALFLDRIIARSGPVAAFTDSTDTATNINSTYALAAGQSVSLRYQNLTAFAATISAGSGVTLSPATMVVPPFSVADILYTQSAASTATMALISTAPIAAPPVLTDSTLTTAGSGTLVAATIAGGILTRSGPTGAFTDTFPSAASILAALPNGQVGQSFVFNYLNGTKWLGTLAADGGSTVTLSGNTLVPPNSYTTLLVTITGATAATVVGLASGPLTSTPTLAVTNNTSAAGATLTAASVASGVVNRSGTSAAFTDTLPTFTLLLAQLPNWSASVNVGQSFMFYYKNTTAYPATLANGTNNTVSGTTVVPPLSVGLFLVTFATTTTFTTVGIGSYSLSTSLPVVQTALTTNGAGTITAAMVAAGLVLRTVPTSAATDTFDTGTNVAAAIPNVNVGQTFFFTYLNNTSVQMTLTGATGFTLTPTSVVVGPGGWQTLLVTCTAANTFTATPYAGGGNVGLPEFQYVTGTTTTTFTAGQITGAKLSVYTSTAATPGSIATRTATQMFGDIPGAYVGLQFVARIINDVVTNSLTITAGSGVTLSGKTNYVATPFGSMDFLITFTSPTACTMVYINGGQSTTA